MSKKKIEQLTKLLKKNPNVLKTAEYQNISHNLNENPSFSGREYQYDFRPETVPNYGGNLHGGNSKNYNDLQSHQDNLHIRDKIQHQNSTGNDLNFNYGGERFNHY